MTPFTYEELQRVFATAAEGWKFQTWPQEYEAVQLPEDVKSKLPIYQDGLEVYAAIPELSKQALIDQLTRGIFDVTAYHEFVGYVVAYTTDPAGGSLQVRPGLDMADLQEFLAVNSLVAGTGT